MRKYLIAAFTLALLATDASACGRLRHRFAARRAARHSTASYSTVGYASYSSSVTYRSGVRGCTNCPAGVVCPPVLPAPTAGPVPVK